MANPYGWDQDVEDRLFEGRIDGNRMRDVYMGIAETTGDAAIRAWCLLDWAAETLSYSGADAGPSDYQAVLDHLPQGYLEASLDGRVRTFAASGASAGDADLWRATTTALAGLTASLRGDVATIAEPMLDAWLAEEGQRRGTTSVLAGGDGAPPPPFPSFDFPASLDDCWADPQLGDLFRTWAMEQPIASDIAFCVAVEQAYSSSPSWSMALEIFATYLDEGAPSRAFVESTTIEAIRAQLPGSDDEFAADAPVGLFYDAHKESAQVMYPWYESFKDHMATPAADTGGGGGGGGGADDGSIVYQ